MLTERLSVCVQHIISRRSKYKMYQRRMVTSQHHQQRKQCLYNCLKTSKMLDTKKLLPSVGVSHHLNAIYYWNYFQMSMYNVYLFRNGLHCIFSFRSYWVGSVSWSPGGLFLACVLKRGSLLMVSRLGGLLTLTSCGCNVDFGPAHFLPLHPLVTYRYTFETFCSSLNGSCYKLLICLGWCS